jgi:hypothetical protein
MKNTYPSTFSPREGGGGGSTSEKDGGAIVHKWGRK